jgi:hypothetical protein
MGEVEGKTYHKKGEKPNCLEISIWMSRCGEKERKKTWIY